MMRYVVLFGILLWHGSSVMAGERFLCAGASTATPLGSRVRAAKLAQMPPQGTRRAVVIFAQFADEEPTPVPEWAAEIFDLERPGSFSHFYHTMSFGQLEVRGRTLPRRYASDRPASAYLNREPGKRGEYREFAREILQKMDAEVDLEQFDNDGPDGVPNSGDDDAFVDYVFIIVRSMPRGFIRDESTGIAGLGMDEFYRSADRSTSGDFIQVGGSHASGSLVQEGTFAQTVGAMAHEFSHGLGLPDLYDLSYEGPEDDSAGIGKWGLMGWGAHGWHGDDGPNPFCAWSLEQLGWIGPGNDRLVEVTGDIAGLELRDLHAGGFIAKVPLRATTVWGFIVQEEYLLLEQRIRTGTYYNRNLPGEGLLVWHVRPLVRGRNDDENGKQVDLVCADGLYQDTGYPRGRIPDGMQGGDNLDFWAHDESYAQTHGGNLGDGTDPFDGTRFTHLGPDTNPSSNPQGITPAACTGLDLTIRRQNEGMALEIRQPRWAGTIRQKVCWAGTVLVDGDLEVTPEGELVIQKNTQVLFTGIDRLRSGRDPTLSELVVYGNFFLHSNYREKIVFQGQKPGEPWYGILFHPVDSTRIQVPENGLELRDSEHGVLFPHLPSHAQGKLWSNYRLADAPGPETAGNGDGQLNPGETFQWVGELANGTLTHYPKIQTRLYWNTSLVCPTWSSHATSRNYLDLPEELVLNPGGRCFFSWPSLTLSPDAQAGQRVEFILETKTSFWSRRDTSFLVVTGDYPAHTAEFEVSGYELRNQSVVVAADRPVSIQVRIQGQVRAADLVVRSPDPIFIVEIPTQRRSGPGDREVFEGIFSPPSAGLYQVFLRVHHPDGGVVFSDTSLYVLATAAPMPPPVLIFIGDHYREKQQERLGQVMTECLAEWGLAAHILPGASVESTLFQSLMEHYMGEGSLLIWLGSTVDEDTQKVFRRFLEHGGRLLLVSSKSYRSPFMEEMLYARVVGLRTSGPIRSLYCNPPLQWDVSCWQLELVSPAEPVLLDEEHQPAGLRIDTGTYRVVYLPLDLEYRESSLYRSFIESSLAFLQQQEVSEVVLEVPGSRHIGEGFVFDTGKATSVRAKVRGMVRAAEVIVWSLPQREQLLVRVMRKVEQEGAAQVYETEIQLPDPGQYQVSLRLHTAGGKILFSSARLRALGVSRQRPVLVMLGTHYSPDERERLCIAFFQGLARLGLEALFLDLVDEDGSLFGALLSNYLEEGELVVWLGDRMYGPAQGAFRSFLTGGGKLFLASLDLNLSPGIDSFLNDMLYTGQKEITRISEIHSAGPLADLQLKFSVRHASFDHLRLPAEPILQDREGEPAGIQVDTGTYRLVCLPFDLGQIQEPACQLLVEASLSFLQQRTVRTELEVPGHERGGQGMVVQPGETIPVQVGVVGPVEQAHLLVRSVPQLEPVREMPMRRMGFQDTTSLFEANFQLPAPGEYRVSLRLHRADGEVLFSPVHLQVFGFVTDNPILVLVGDHYKSSQTEALRAEVTRVFGRLDRIVTFVDSVGRDEDYFAGILRHYLDPGDLAIWLGNRLDPQAQEIFRGFLGKGGRLFMASPYLHLSQNIETFLREVVYTERTFGWRNSQIFPTEVLPGFPRVFSVGHVPLPPLRPPAEPLFLDDEDDIAGLRVDTGTYRLVYLSFDLKDIDSGLTSPLLAETLPFLLEDAVQEAWSTAVRDDPAFVPAEFRLLPSYPNPFNGWTTITYWSPQSAKVQLTIHNIGGQPVKKLVDRVQDAGQYQVAWDGRDDDGQVLASGVYLYRLRAGDGGQVETRKLVLVR